MKHYKLENDHGEFLDSSSNASLTKFRDFATIISSDDNEDIILQKIAEERGAEFLEFDLVAADINEPKDAIWEINGDLFSLKHAR